jgi:hypothetical protein
MNNWVKTIFRHDTENGGAWYSVAMSGKDPEGNKRYEYWPIDFPQGTNLPDRVRVELKDFFITFYTRRDGGTQYKFVVQDFLVGQQQPAPQQQQGYGQYRGPQQYQRPARTPAYQPQGGYAPQPQYQQPPQYQQQPQYQQPQPAPQPAPQADAFEAIDEDVPF